MPNRSNACPARFRGSASPGQVSDPAPGAIQRYLRSLVRRHRALDEEIRLAARTSLGTSPSVAVLKKMRLALKDRIATLSRQAVGRAG